MKYSIVIKFLALLLCAAALLGAVGSAVGILAMTELGLYEKSYYQAYGEHLHAYAESLAQDLAERHAAMSLGGFDTQMADRLQGNLWAYGIYQFQNIGYELRDGAGEVLQSDPLSESLNPVFEKTFTVDGSYPKLLSTMTETEKLVQEMATLSLEEGEDIQVPVMPDTDVDIYDITVGYTNGDSETYGSGTTPLGRLTRQENGNFLLVCNENLGWMALHHGIAAEHIRLEDRNGETVYQAFSNYNAVLDYTYEGDDTWMLLSGRTVPQQPLLIDALPADGAAVESITVSYADDSSESFGSVSGIGWLSYNEGGRVVFRSYDAGLMEIPDATVTHIAFLDEGGAPLFEARDAEGVGRFYLDGENRVCFRSSYSVLPDEATAREAADAETTVATEAVMPEMTTPKTTLEATIPSGTETITSEPAAEPIAPVTTPAAKPQPSVSADLVEVMTTPTAAAQGYDSTAAAGIRQFGYYDHELEQEMVAEYTYEEMPEYTVAVSFGPNALQDEYQWQLLGWACLFQKELPAVLGVSLLVFAVMVIYLCCAAGRKSGADTVRAGGLNALPLDLYGVCGFFAEIGLLLAGTEGGVHLLRRNFFVGAAAVGSIAFAACVIFVAFCFACAAQFKMSGGYWWRNSLCGRCLRLGWKACLWLVHKGGPGLLRLIKAVWKLIRFFWELLAKTVSRLLGLLGRGIGWLWGKLMRFFSLLPVTWQWLLVGMILVLWLLIAVAGRFEGLMVLWVCAALAAVIYGGHCFGTLLGSAKRMRKGDLDEKVDDRLLIGSFREFADELNGLADVAVVAARKQLKSERMKTELITNVSHDIKTPLTSIINYVDLLKKAQTQPEREACLEVLDRQSQRLKKLVEDLMEMSKASTGNLAVDIQRVDAAEAINQALGEFSDKLEKAQLIPVFRQPEKPVEMMADGRLVWRVMSNLLGNAVKYALPGTRVYLDLAKVEDKVVISVKNISREELNVAAEELLERFVRGDASRNTEGSGLGLNIARSLMELQKGQLQLLVDGDLFKVTLIFPGV